MEDAFRRLDLEDSTKTFTSTQLSRNLQSFLKLTAHTILFFFFLVLFSFDSKFEWIAGISSQCKSIPTAHIKHKLVFISRGLIRPPLHSAQITAKLAVRSCQTRTKESNFCSDSCSRWFGRSLGMCCNSVHYKINVSSHIVRQMDRLADRTSLVWGQGQK